MADNRSRDPKAELSNLLREGRATRKEVEEMLRDPSAPPEVVLRHAHALARLARREQALVRLLGRTLGGGAPVREAESLRERSLAVLGETGVAARAAFLAAHLELRDGIPADVRRFGALRRDEAQAWQQNPGVRPVYLTPALDIDGHVYGAWMTRSDWPLNQRLIVSKDHASLLEIRELLLLIHEAGGTRSTPATVEPLFIHHAKRLLDVLPPLSVSDESRWRSELEEKGRFAVRLLDASVAAQVSKAISMLVKSLTEEEQLWGR